MLLQELFLPQNAHINEAMGITLDAQSMVHSMPPPELKSIGFVFKLDEENMIDEDLLDIIISYKLTHLQVTLEVPSHLMARIEPKYVLQLASNVDFSVSLLPPGHALVDASFTPEDYTQMIERFTDEILSRQNFDKSVMPITNFFQYVMLEKIVGSQALSAFEIQDRYITENFVQVMSLEHSDAFKAVIRSRLYSYYGSQGEFEEVASLMFDSLYQRARSVFTQQVQHTMEHTNNTNNTSNTSDTNQPT